MGEEANLDADAVFGGCAAFFAGRGGIALAWRHVCVMCKSCWLWWRAGEDAGCGSADGIAPGPSQIRRVVDAFRESSMRRQPHDDESAHLRMMNIHTPSYLQAS